MVHIDSAGTHIARIHISDESRAYYAINLPLPPGAGEWTIDKWNAFRTRVGFHDDDNSQTAQNPGGLDGRD